MSNSQHSKDVIVRLEGISKYYYFYTSPFKRAMSVLFPWAGIQYARHKALDGVSLEISRGETVGVIGRNGAGKSTLLGVIGGLIEPSAGARHVKGSVAAILELGAGFNPELSGRENAELYARLRGSWSQGLKAQVDFIDEFSDLGEYFHRPIKCYSSGMAARLAFACAISLNSDLLIIDEALAVGDVKFQSKCLSYIKEKRNQGVSIILVAHSPEVIQRNCDSALLIEKGALIAYGAPRDVTDAYESILYGEKNSAAREKHAENVTDYSADLGRHIERLLSASSQLTLLDKANYNKYEARHDNSEGRVRIDDFILEAKGVLYPSVIESGSTVSLYVKVSVETSPARIQTGIAIYTKDGIKLYGANTLSLLGKAINVEVPGVYWVAYRLSMDLINGDYFVDVGCSDHSCNPPVILDLRRRFIHISVMSDGKCDGLLDFNASCAIYDAGGALA